MTNRHPIFEMLSRGTLIFDGATGTYAKALNDFPAGPVECACLTAPEQVLALHRAYLQAGCNLIKTNTFAAHSGLAVTDEEHQKKLISAAYETAMRAAEGKAIVFADIGPAPAQDEPQTAFIRAADVFLSCGADAFLFETQPSLQGICEAAAHIKSRNPAAFIAVSFAADPDGFTRSGEFAPAMIRQLQTCEDIDAVGLNCVCGAYHMRLLIEQLGALQKPLIAMPNAGYPHLIDGRMYYDSDPAYFAQQAAACAHLGAAIVGGCCGTTPVHMTQVSRMLEQQDNMKPVAAVGNDLRKNACKSRIYQKLLQGERSILVELDPPRSAQIGSFIDGARRLCAAGADAITIADCPIGRARMDSSLLACKLRREYGMETIPHMTCRDRNVNATKALLLGLSMEGVHNVLAVTGDPVPTSDRGSVKSVFQFHSRILARFVNSLCQSGEVEPFFLCGALNINAVNFEAELEKAKLKEEAGIQAFLTQPVLSEQAVKNLHKARAALKGYLFGGLFPIVSQKNAHFMDSEVSGVVLDARIMEAYEGLDRAQGEEMARRLCRDAAARIAPDIDGYYIMTPFQRIDLVEKVISDIKRECSAV